MSWTEITRLHYRRDQLRYASDTTDAEWSLLAGFMPERSPLGRPRTVDLRAVLNAISTSLRQVASGALCQRTFRRALLFKDISTVGATTVPGTGSTTLSSAGFVRQSDEGRFLPLASSIARA